MFENIIKFFKNIGKKESTKESSDTAKERLHLVLMQDRANVSADFLELMKQEIIEVIKKYIEVDEKAIDVRLTNKASEDGTVGAPALYANIPITTIKNEVRKINNTEPKSVEEKKEDNSKLVENVDEAKVEKKKESEQETSQKESEVEQKEKTAKKKVEKKESEKKEKTEKKVKETEKVEKEKESKTKVEKDEGEKVKQLAKKK